MSETIAFELPELVHALKNGVRSVWYRDDVITGTEVESALDAVGLERYGMKGRMDRPGSYCAGGAWIRPVSSWVSLTSGHCPTRGKNEDIQYELDTIASEAIKNKLLFPDQSLTSPGSMARALLTRHTAGFSSSTAGWVRHLGRRAVHQGPMMALVASAESSVLHDRSQAFLHALRVPVGTRWSAVAGIANGDLTGGDLDSLGASLALSKSWPHIERAMNAPDSAMPGFIEAEIDVHPMCGRMVTIPAETQYGPIYATGHVRGVWTVRQLAAEIERGGVTLRTVHALVVADETQFVYEPVYRRIAGIEYKALRKGLYTRAWGSLLAGGSILLTPDRPEKVPEGTRVIRSAYTSWWATVTPKGFDDDPKASMLNRPDHAALIAADNDRAVRETLWHIEDRGGLVHGVLTDAIMHDGTAALSGWREEVCGRLRQYGTGRYWYGGERATSSEHNGDLLRWRAMGASAMTLGAAETCWHTGHDDGRAWNLDPALNAAAISAPLHLNSQIWAEHFQNGHEIGL